jgi:hypothetical protein
MNIFETNDDLLFNIGYGNDEEDDADEDESFISEDGCCGKLSEKSSVTLKPMDGGGKFLLVVEFGTFGGG